MGLCRERAAYEGQGAVEMEALVDAEVLQFEDDELAYPFAIPRLKDSNLPYIEPLGMWAALLGDLVLNTPVPTMAARFHKGLAQVICRMVDKVAHVHHPDQPRCAPWRSAAACSRTGCCWSASPAVLRAAGYTVLAHRPGALQRRVAWRWARPWSPRPGNWRRRRPPESPLRRKHLHVLSASPARSSPSPCGQQAGPGGRAGCAARDQHRLRGRDEAHPVAACIGDWVLVHVGFAMSRINEQEARLTLDVLKMLGEGAVRDRRHARQRHRAGVR